MLPPRNLLPPKLETWSNIKYSFNIYMKLKSGIMIHFHHQPAGHIEIKYVENHYFEIKHQKGQKLTVFDVPKIICKISNCTNRQNLFDFWDPCSLLGTCSHHQVRNLLYPWNSILYFTISRTYKSKICWKTTTF